MPTPQTNIWQFEANLSNHLLHWAGLSVGAGAALLVGRDRYRRGLGSQFIGWGAIDGALALLGLRRARWQATDPAAHDLDRQAAERRTLRRVLQINTALDVLYVTGGLALASTRGRDDAFIRGSGWGIAVQGAFLFAFDLVNALSLSEPA